MPLLQNHIAVVTGAGSGIGRAIALGYARESATVVLLDINEKTAAEVAEEIRAGRTASRLRNKSLRRSDASLSWSTTPASTAATPSRLILKQS